MARRDGRYTGAPCKQGRRPKRSSSTPEQAQSRPPAHHQANHGKFNGNSTVVQMLQIIDKQASTIEALRDQSRHEKTNSAVLASHLQETMTKASGYNQSLATTTAELCSTKQMLQYTTEHLKVTQDELQQANELIQTQDYMLHKQEGTICSLNANIEDIKQQMEALTRHSEFTQKQMAYERNDYNSQKAELKECKERLAAAERRSTHLAEHKAQLQAAVAGNYTALLSAALAGGSGYRQLVWLFMLHVFTAVQSCVLLHVLILSTLFIVLAKGLPAAPWLLGEARVYAVVSWALVCDLLRYLGACAAVYCSSGYASCVGLLYDISSYAKSLVCSPQSASLNLWASSSEKLLPYLNSWGSARTSSAAVTPASSNRSSISVDAVSACVQDDVAADVIAVVSLKQGLVLAKVAGPDV